MKNHTVLRCVAPCLVLVLAACSTVKTPGATDARIPAAQNYDAVIQPARIPPNPQGAFALSSATGCDIIYVAKAVPADTVTYAVRPTSRMPDGAQCAERLRDQPGINSISLVR
jgi:hypothetical protein